MRLLVCGGRDFADELLFADRMSGVDARYPIHTIIEGGARGADSMARHWAHNNLRFCDTYRAEWEQFGLRAGSIRNRRMAIEGRPDLVLAFPGGPGTRNMMGIARELRIPVWEAVPFPPPPPWP